MKALSTKEFISRSASVHGNLYGYSSTVYTTAKEKVVITCSVHGDFKQRPDHHLNGKGCKKCADEAVGQRFQKDTSMFIEAANKVHSNAYDYSKVEYVSAITPVAIVCKKHGEFQQKPSVHLMGCGCSKCGKQAIGNKFRSNKEEFVDKAVAKHGDRYDYSLVDYASNKKKVVIICKDHGQFEQAPDKHLQGNGCPKCADQLRGWEYSAWEAQGKVAHNFVDFRLYVVKLWNDKECFIKIGKTFNSYRERFSNIAKDYKYEVLYEKIADPRTISELEQEYLRLNKEYTYLPLIEFGGRYECFSKVVIDNKEYA